jgi:hypothetical protein
VQVVSYQAALTSRQKGAEVLRSTVRSAVVAVAALAAFAVGCSEHTTSGGAGATPPDAAGSGVTAQTEQPTARPPAATPPVEKVRDAFAGLQATLDDACTPDNCNYFLNRVLSELHRMDRAMKADPQGPSHFSKPIELIKILDTTLGSDQSFDNLKRHQDLLIGIRDRINAWMQDHPSDYR